MQILEQDQGAVKDQNVVKVTRRGQTTIPLEIRRKCGIKEGDKLIVEATDRGILFKPILRLLDMAGFMAGHGTPEELKKEIENIREEY